MPVPCFVSIFICDLTKHISTPFWFIVSEAVPARHFLMVNHAAQAAVDRRLRNSASAAALTNNGEGQRAIEDAIQKDNKRTISAYRHVQRPSSTRSELGGLRGGYMVCFAFHPDFVLGHEQCLYIYHYCVYDLSQCLQLQPCIHRMPNLAAMHCWPTMYVSTRSEQYIIFCHLHV